MTHFDSPSELELSVALDDVRGLDEACVVRACKLLDVNVVRANSFDVTVRCTWRRWKALNIVAWTLAEELAYDKEIGSEAKDVS